MDETRAINLSKFRVGENRRLGKPMTDEEISLRRQFIRTMLRGVTAWQGLTDEQIDNVRIFKIRGDWYIEDQNFYEYAF